MTKKRIWDRISVIIRVRVTVKVVIRVTGASIG